MKNKKNWEIRINGEKRGNRENIGIVDNGETEENNDNGDIRYLEKRQWN